MIAKRIFGSLLIVGLMATQTMVAGAQTGRTDRHRGGWSALAMNATKSVGPVGSDPRESDESTMVETQETTGNAKLVGTWVMHIPESPGSPAFNALQTFTSDGTMTETSDLLAQLSEGPAHGVWSGKKNDYLVTFELFVFDENHQSAGRVRVRCAIKISGDDQLSAKAAVDFIEPDGNVIADIGSTPFSGKRIKVLPAQ